MKKFAIWIFPVLVLSLALFALAPRAIRASDHADPINLKEPESNITDLFFYPKGDQMILILDVRRALLAPEPYNLAPFEYVVHMDLTTPVTYGNDSERARYGGTVANPERIHDDVTISLRLNNDATLKEKSIKGLKNPDAIRIFVGVRDDPFIFPRFFKKNTIAMVMSIPMSSFPDGQQDWILWGSTYKSGKQVDHVGRSNRTQQARFDSLNTLPPSQHVPEIMRLLKKWNDRFTFVNSFKEPMLKAAAGFIQYLLQIRKYDVVADVMIYTTRHPAGFPNGRFLTDDVAAQTCATGDCILQDLSFIEGGWPRATVNDKPFLEDWPYLAEPWPEAPEPPPSTKSIWPYIIAFVIVDLIVGWLIVEGLRRLVLWGIRRRQRAVA